MHSLTNKSFIEAYGCIVTCDIVNRIPVQLTTLLLVIRGQSGKQTDDYTHCSAESKNNKLIVSTFSGLRAEFVRLLCR